MAASMNDQTLSELLEAIAAKQPTPGGGAVAPIVGALASALAQMVVAYSAGKKQFAEHEPSLREAIGRLERGRAALLELAEEDASAYGVVNELMKLPKDDPRRCRDLPGDAELAAQAPLATLAGAVALLRLFESLAPITNRNLKSDLAIAAILAEASAQASAQNVRINLPLLGEVCDASRVAWVSSQLATLLRDATTLRDRVLALTES